MVHQHRNNRRHSFAHAGRLIDFQHPRRHGGQVVVGPRPRPQRHGHRLRGAQKSLHIGQYAVEGNAGRFEATRNIPKVGSGGGLKGRFRDEPRVVGFAQRQHRPARTQRLDGHPAGANNQAGTRQPAGHIIREAHYFHPLAKFDLQLRQRCFAGGGQLRQLPADEGHAQGGELAEHARKNLPQQGRRPLALAAVKATDERESDGFVHGGVWRDD